MRLRRTKRVGGVDKIGDTAAFGIARGVLDAENDGVGVLDVVLSHIEDAALGIGGHALRVMLSSETKKTANINRDRYVK